MIVVMILENFNGYHKDGIYYLTEEMASKLISLKVAEKLPVEIKMEAPSYSNKMCTCSCNKKCRNDK